MFGSVLVDSFKVRYMGPSELELKAHEVTQLLKDDAFGKKSAPFLELGVVCVEDVLSGGGALHRSPVVAKVCPCPQSHSLLLNIVFLLIVSFPFFFLFRDFFFPIFSQSSI